MPLKTNKIVREVGGLIPSRDAMFCFRLFVVSDFPEKSIPYADRPNYLV
jgi:hypothetical protein